MPEHIEFKISKQTGANCKHLKCLRNRGYCHFPNFKTIIQNELTVLMYCLEYCLTFVMGITLECCKSVILLYYIYIRLLLFLFECTNLA